MKHLGTVQLETERLILRRFTLDDANAMFNNWTSDPEVTKFMTWKTHTSAEESKMILSDWINRYDEENYYQWAIVFKENGADPIGGISSVRNSDTKQVVHIGYCIGRKWWHKGITSEALSAIIKFFFEEVSLNRIESSHDLNNPNSGKVMTKCGLLYEGTQREGGWNNQGLMDNVMYAILQKDYDATHG